MKFYKKIMLFITLVPVVLSAIKVFAHGDKPHSEKKNENIPLATSYLGYKPPAPGSYRLPPIKQAVDGDVIDADGKKHRLFDLMADKYVLFSFIYSKCYDPTGCPLATYTLNLTRMILDKDPSLAKKIIFLSLSFDPEKDTPEVMRRYVELHGVDEARDKKQWRFLTTSSIVELQPILDGYGQYVVREFDSKGKYTGGFSHVLKVYLIDPGRRIRNIYSTSFLYPELIINDIKTLVLEKAEY
jgi:cytochrome c peroxidase